jgi:hypothetical protein
LGPESRFTLNTLSDAALMYPREGKYALAETCAAEVLAAWQHNLGPQSAVTMEAAADLVLVYLSQGKFAESEPLAREDVEFDRKNRPDASHNLEYLRLKLRSIVDNPGPAKVQKNILSALG